jgi:hypothetical protein
VVLPSGSVAAVTLLSGSYPTLVTAPSGSVAAMVRPSVSAVRRVTYPSGLVIVFSSPCRYDRVVVALLGPVIVIGCPAAL